MITGYIRHDIDLIFLNMAVLFSKVQNTPIKARKVGEEDIFYRRDVVQRLPPEGEDVERNRDEP